MSQTVLKRKNITVAMQNEGNSCIFSTTSKTKILCRLHVATAIVFVKII